MNAKMKSHIEEALAQGVRLDGRKLDEMRPITIETGIVGNAEGSAKVVCGETEILAGVKLTLGKPFPDRPENGALMVNAELIPMSSPDFESGPPGIDAIEASRVIDRGIRESDSIDEKKLCVEVGEKVWIANVDVYPINFDGNIIDVGGIAAAAAIRVARFPSIKDGAADYKNPTKDGLPLSTTPVPISVAKIGPHYVIDPTAEEEKAADCRLTVTTTDKGDVCSLQKSGIATLTTKDVDAMIDLAVAKGKDVRKIIDKASK